MIILIVVSLAVADDLIRRLVRKYKRKRALEPKENQAIDLNQ